VLVLSVLNISRSPCDAESSTLTIYSPKEQIDDYIIIVPRRLTEVKSINPFSRVLNCGIGSSVQARD
jgi:hypothetical protein